MRMYNDVSINTFTLGKIFAVSVRFIRMGFIRYVGTGRLSPIVTISFSMNKGKAWQERKLVAGQTFHIPPNCTNLLVDKVPYSIHENYEIRGGQISTIS